MLHVLDNKQSVNLMVALEITSDTRKYPLCTMNICTKFQSDPPNGVKRFHYKNRCRPRGDITGKGRDYRRH